MITSWNVSALRVHALSQAVVVRTVCQNVGPLNSRSNELTEETLRAHTRSAASVASHFASDWSSSGRVSKGHAASAPVECVRSATSSDPVSPLGPGGMKAEGLGARRTRMFEEQQRSRGDHNVPLLRLSSHVQCALDPVRICDRRVYGCPGGICFQRWRVSPRSYSDRGPCSCHT